MVNVFRANYVHALIPFCSCLFFTSDDGKFLSFVISADAAAYVQIWTDLLLDEGKMVCVEIVANDKTKAFNSVIFLGSISHSTLIKAYDKKVCSWQKYLTNKKRSETLCNCSVGLAQWFSTATHYNNPL